MVHFCATRVARYNSREHFFSPQMTKIFCINYPSLNYSTFNLYEYHSCLLADVSWAIYLVVGIDMTFLQFIKTFFFKHLLGRADKMKPYGTSQICASVMSRNIKFVCQLTNITRNIIIHIWKDSEKKLFCPIAIVSLTHRVLSCYTNQYYMSSCKSKCYLNITLIIYQLYQLLLLQNKCMNQAEITACNMHVKKWINSFFHALHSPSVPEYELECMHHEHRWKIRKC